MLVSGARRQCGSDEGDAICPGGKPIFLVLLFTAYLCGALLIDSYALLRGRVADRPAWAIVMAALTLSLLFAFWFALSWRPIFSAVASSITLLIVMLISDHKYRNTQEPLSFVDFALIPQIWRHPRLYQAEFLHHRLFFPGLALLVLIIIGWWTFLEPSMLPATKPWLALAVGLAAFALALGWLLAGPLPKWLIAGLYRRMIPADSARYVREIGLSASLTAGLIGWRHAPSGSHQWPAPAAIARHAGAAPIIIAVQSESFCDLFGAGLHHERLPAFERAQKQALSCGRLKVPVQGAWTLRSEYVFLTGRDIDAIGIDALHPYLRLQHPPRTIASQLREAGFATTFMHPFDMQFFNRAHALPRLGFDTLIDENDFPEARREGYYVSDLTLADRVLSLAASERRPIFCMAATMENHNPWDKRRLPGIATPIERYLHHRRNADSMITRLTKGLEKLGRPAVFAFYGDHVPAIRSFGFPYPDPRTDYFVMGLRDGVWLKGQRRDIGLHQLADIIIESLDRVTCSPRQPVMAPAAGMM